MVRYMILTTAAFVMVGAGVLGALFEAPGAADQPRKFGYNLSVYRTCDLRPGQERAPFFATGAFHMQLPQSDPEDRPTPTPSGPSNPAAGTSHKYLFDIRGTRFPAKAEVYYLFESTKGLEREYGHESRVCISKRSIELRHVSDGCAILSDDGKYLLVIQLMPN